MAFMQEVAGTSATTTTLTIAGDGNTPDDETNATVLTVAKVVPALLLLCGSVGNVLTLIALHQSQSETLSAGSRVYLKVLTVVDLVALVVAVIRFWLLALTQSDIFASQAAVCKVLPWLENSFLMAQPWLLIAMIVQVHEGLRVDYNSPGRNVTRWKALVFSASAVSLALTFNIHRVFLFGACGQTGNNSTNNNGTAAVSGFEGRAEVTTIPHCGPSSPEYADFVNRAWPWLSLVGTLGIPLIAISTGIILVLRLLFLRSRQTDRACSPEWFESFVISVVILSLITLLTSFPLCILCYTNAATFWTGYGNLFIKGERFKQGEAFYVSGILRVIFYAQFALRWAGTCWCNKLWSVILSMCPRTNSMNMSRASEGT